MSSSVSGGSIPTSSSFSRHPSLPPSRTTSSSSTTSSTGAPNRSTTSTPLSQPLATSASMPGSTRNSAHDATFFDSLFGTPSTSSAGKSTPTVSVDGASGGMGTATRVEKGKAVAREQVEQSLGANDEDELERQRRVDKVLKRAEASKLARAFRNRLALASYKTSRGWQDVNLDVIEPHLREEALKRQDSPSSISPVPQSNGNASLPFPPSHQAALQTSQLTKPPPVNAQPLSPPANQPYQYQINYSPARTTAMETVLAGGGTPGLAHKRSRSIVEPAQASSPVYAPTPQPQSLVSPYSTANVYRSAGSKRVDSPTDARASKRRNVEGTTPRSRQKSAGSRKGTPLRQSTNGTPQQPVSSTDPNFSSFVDAAAALTGMARVPSDPSMSGSDEDQAHQPFQHPFQPHPNQVSPFPSRLRPHFAGSQGGSPSVIAQIPHPPHHHHAFPQAHSLSSSQNQPYSSMPPNGHPSNNYVYSSHVTLQHHDGGTPPVRPSTPEKVKTPGMAGSGDNSEVAAADLMLFLAHSPSPVQTRKSQPTLGDGAGIKGRRLFSGVNGGGGFGGEDDGSDGSLAQSVFGGDLNSFATSTTSNPGPSSLSRSSSSPFITSSGPSNSRALDAPFDPTPTSSSSVSLAMDPSKPAFPTSSTSSLSASTSIGLGPPPILSSSSASTATPIFPTSTDDPPGTPRGRQPSFNGQSWESFINASPSPTRSSIPRGETPPGLEGSALA